MGKTLIIYLYWLMLNIAKTHFTMLSWAKFYYAYWMFLQNSTHYHAWFPANSKIWLVHWNFRRLSGTNMSLKI